MYQSDNDWLDVRRNIGKAQQVWLKLGGFLRREGAYHLTSVAFYRESVQSVLLFGAEMWVLSMAM